MKAQPFARLFLRLLPLLCIPLLTLSTRPSSEGLLPGQSQQMEAQALSPEEALEAAADLAERARRSPWRDELWEQAGLLALQGEDYQAAISYLGAAKRLSPEARIQLGQAHELAGEAEEARRVWEEALEEAPATKRAELLGKLSNLAFSKGEWKEAEERLEALLQERLEDAQANYRLGLLLAAREPKLARAPLERAALADPALGSQVEALSRALRQAGVCPDPACALVESGRALGSLNEWALAATAFERATAVRPDYAEAWAFLGEARQHVADRGKDPQGQAGEIDSGDIEALAALEKALTLDPKSVSTHLLLALYWQRRGDSIRALVFAKAAAELEPDNPAVQAELGRNLAKAGDLTAALTAYRQAVELAPRDPSYWRLLASFTLEYDHQVREAGLPAARQAVLLAPEDPASLLSLGQVFFQLADLVNAKRFLQRAIEIDPNYAPAHLHLGLVHLLQDNPSQAYQQIALARSLAPGTAAAEQAERILASSFGHR